MKNRPGIKEWKRPEHIDDYPVGPAFEGGHLNEKNSGWRTFRPEIDKEKCINCLKCYIVCPDGVIYKEDNSVAVDYDFCKGCGICAFECPVKAIEMKKEERA